MGVTMVVEEVVEVVVWSEWVLVLPAVELMVAHELMVSAERLDRSELMEVVDVLERDLSILGVEEEEEAEDGRSWQPMAARLIRGLYEGEEHCFLSAGGLTEDDVEGIVLEGDVSMTGGAVLGL